METTREQLVNILKHVFNEAKQQFLLSGQKILTNETIKEVKQAIEVKG